MLSDLLMMWTLVVYLLILNDVGDPEGNARTFGRQRLSCQFSCWYYGSLKVTDVPVCGTSIACLDAAIVVVKVERHRRLALVIGIG